MTSVLDRGAFEASDPDSPNLAVSRPGMRERRSRNEGLRLEAQASPEEVARLLRAQTITVRCVQCPDWCFEGRADEALSAQTEHLRSHGRKRKSVRQIASEVRRAESTNLVVYESPGQGRAQPISLREELPDHKNERTQGEHGVYPKVAHCQNPECGRTLPQNRRPGTIYCPGSKCRDIAAWMRRSLVERPSTREA